MWNVISLGMSPKCKSSHCRCEACRRKIRSSTCPNRTAMRAIHPNVHILIKSMLTTSCTTAFDWIAIALITLYRNVKVNYSKSIWDFVRSKNVVNCLILKRLFLKYDAWLIFCSDNAATISEAYKNIVSVETNSRYLEWRWGRPKLT